MQNIQTQNPELHYFTEITKIPHPSGHLSAIQNYLHDFAQKNSLGYQIDKAGNILITHPGKSQKTIILQAHLDMVPAVEDGHHFDFIKDGLDTYIEDGWIRANRTSLGADDASGIAIALAALSAAELKDCSLTAVFTADEETTMAGAQNISPDWLNGYALINIDSDEFGVITASSARCITLSAEFTPETEDAAKDWYELNVSGLLSGHSGVDIDKGRQNAIILAAQFLKTLHQVKIAKIDGGSVQNAIPAKASVLFSAEDTDIASLLEKFASTVKTETEPGLTLSVKKTNAPDASWTNKFSAAQIETITTLPNGLFDKNELGPINSSNLGVIRTDTKNHIQMKIMVRSNSDSSAFAEKIADHLSFAGAKTAVEHSDPGWKSDVNSVLIEETKEIFASLFGKEMTVCSTHGGLECGYFAQKNPNLLIESIGPQIENPHSPDERMNLDSFSKTRELIFRLIRKISEVK